MNGFSSLQNEKKTFRSVASAVSQFAVGLHLSFATPR